MNVLRDHTGVPVVAERWDGDTIRLVLCPERGDTYSAYTPWLRLAGIDASEKSGKDWRCAEQYLYRRITKAESITVALDGWSFARQVARITVDGQDLAQAMIETGHAKQYEEG